MDQRALDIASTVEAITMMVSAGTTAIDPADAARQAGVPETELPAVIIEVEILLRSVLKSNKE